MRRLITTALLSLFLVSGNIMLADNHNNHRNNGNARTENRNSRDNNRDRKNTVWKVKGGKSNNHGNGNVRHNPGYDKRPVVNVNRPPKHPENQLRQMVAHVAPGAGDVMLWQIDPETYIVKYLLGGKYYTQRLYPYSGRYGSRGVVNINWNPLSSWTLLPSINITLPININ